MYCLEQKWDVESLDLPTNKDINDFWVKEFAKSGRFASAMEVVKGMTEASPDPVYETLASMFAGF